MENSFLSSLARICQPQECIKLTVTYFPFMRGVVSLKCEIRPMVHCIHFNLVSVNQKSIGRLDLGNREFFDVDRLHFKDTILVSRDHPNPCQPSKSDEFSLQRRCSTTDLPPKTSDFLYPPTFQ